MEIISKPGNIYTWANKLFFDISCEIENPGGICTFICRILNGWEKCEEYTVRSILYLKNKDNAFDLYNRNINVKFYKKGKCTYSIIFDLLNNEPKKTNGRKHPIGNTVDPFGLTEQSKYENGHRIYFCFGIYVIRNGRKYLDKVHGINIDFIGNRIRHKYNGSCDIDIDFIERDITDLPENSICEYLIRKPIDNYIIHTEYLDNLYKLYNNNNRMKIEYLLNIDDINKNIL